jgi:hypothetical protein
MGEGAWHDHNEIVLWKATTLENINSLLSFFLGVT